MYYSIYDSPIGRLLLVADAAGLRFIKLPESKRKPDVQPEWSRSDRRLRDVRDQLKEYFEGKRQAFDLPLVPNGTHFQMEVLGELMKIPYGSTRSYEDVARSLGRPKAVRAVGAANGRNPIPIVIPCHRVIGKNGSLTGFGGGLPAKSYLLSLEGVVSQDEILARRRAPRPVGGSGAERGTRAHGGEV